MSEEALMDVSNRSIDDEDCLCIVCYELMTAPKTLPCGHTFCSRCIDQVVGRRKTMQCPNCRRTHSVPKQGFMKSYGYERLIEKMKRKHRMETGDEESEKMKKNTLKCADCDEANEEKALAACETCDSNVCFRCLAQSHIKSDHKWKNLSDVITERREKWLEEIKCKWTPLYEQFNAAVAEMKKMKRETDVARNNARSDILEAHTLLALECDELTKTRAEELKRAHDVLFVPEKWCDNEARQAMTRMLKELPSDVANMTIRMQTKMRSYCQLAKNVRELVEKWQVEMASIELDAGENETQAPEMALSNKGELTSTTGADAAKSDKAKTPLARAESPRPGTSHLASVFSPEPSSSATPITANGYMSRHELKSSGGGRINSLTEALGILPKRTFDTDTDDDDEDLMQRSVKRARTSDEKRDEELARALQKVEERSARTAALLSEDDETDTAGDETPMRAPAASNSRLTRSASTASTSTASATPTTTTTGRGAATRSRARGGGTATRGARRGTGRRGATGRGARGGGSATRGSTRAAAMPSPPSLSESSDESDTTESDINELRQLMNKAKVLSSSQRDMVTATLYYIGKTGFPKVPNRAFDAHELPARVRLNARGHELVIRKDSVALMCFDTNVGYNVITPSLSRQEMEVVREYVKKAGRAGRVQPDDVYDGPVMRLAMEKARR